MKTPLWFPSRIVLACLAIVAAAGIARAAAVANDRAAAKFELPRLKARGNPHDALALAGAKATVDELAPGANPHARSASSGNLSWLAVDGGKSWSRPLRGGPKDTTFVSFFAYGSEGTIFDVAGARIRIRAGNTPGYAQLQASHTSATGVAWINFGGPVRIEMYGGAPMAALPVLTLRLDRREGVWDLYVANRLVLTDRPLAALPKGAPNQFSLHAGTSGARVNGLASADENPLFEDENANGIDDDFEKGRRGGALLPPQAAGRVALARQWQEDQKQRQVKPWSVQRPLPDGAPGAPTPARKKK